MDLNSANGTYINGIRLEQNESMVLEKGMKSGLEI